MGKISSPCDILYIKYCTLQNTKTKQIIKHKNQWEYFLNKSVLSIVLNVAILSAIFIFAVY